MIPKQERDLAARASKHEATPRRRVMLRLYSEGRGLAEIHESLVKQGLLLRGDEQSVADELKACLARQKARDKQTARQQTAYFPAAAPETPPPSE